MPTAKDRAIIMAIRKTYGNRSPEEGHFKWMARELKDKFTDRRTGLPRAEYVTQLKFPEALEGSMRTGTPLSVGMLDIDHFKLLNDELGHDYGDMALAVVSESMREGFRRGDALCRYGGEEFAGLLPNTGLEKGYMIFNRARGKVEADTREKTRQGGLKGKITLSGGVASSDFVGLPLIMGDRGRGMIREYLAFGGRITRKLRSELDKYSSYSGIPQHVLLYQLGTVCDLIARTGKKQLGDYRPELFARAWDVIYKAADMALYNAKNNGRNRIEVYR